MIPVPNSQYSRWGEAIAALISVGAGIYLLSEKSPLIPGVAGTSWLQVIAHGLGAYFIARGIWMFSQLGTQRTAAEALERLVEQGGGWWDESELAAGAPPGTGHGPAVAGPPTWEGES